MLTSLACFGRFLFWTEESDGTIRRCDLNGDSLTSIVSTRLVRPSFLAVHHGNKELFWVNTGLGKVERSDFDGNGRSDVWRHSRVAVGFYVAMEVHNVSCLRLCACLFVAPKVPYTKLCMLYPCVKVMYVRRYASPLCVHPGSAGPIDLHPWLMYM